MRAVIDAGYFIDRCVPQEHVSEGFIPQSVRDELKDRLTDEYYSFYSFNISVRSPAGSYVSEVREAIAGKHLGLSDADMDVVALMLELSDDANSKWVTQENINDTSELCCLTKDNGVKQALLLLGLCSDPEFSRRRFKLRCFSCYTLYSKEVDFCKECGHNTITRVTVVGEGEDERVMLAKNFRFRPKVLRDERGGVIKSGGTRHYEQYKERLARQQKKNVDFF